MKYKNCVKREPILDLNISADTRMLLFLEIKSQKKKKMKTISKFTSKKKKMYPLNNCKLNRF